MTKRYGLIGYPLSHSFSKGYFTQKFEQERITDCRYDNFPIEAIEKLPDLVEEFPDLIGLNVTLPYKQSVIPYLDKLSNAAEAIGAVNTIKIKNGQKLGFNTDEIGFRVSLLELLESYPYKVDTLKALVLGTGGAAKAVYHVLKQLGIDFRSVSRSKAKGDITYEEIDYSIIKENLLLVNTTPLGMLPDVETAPNLPYNAISDQHFLYDLVYNPKQTVFLKEGLTRSAKVMNGLKMLHTQAEASWKIWNELDEH